MADSKTEFFKMANSQIFFVKISWIGYQGWVEILMITLVYSKRVSVRNNLLHSVIAQKLSFFGNSNGVPSEFRS